MPAQIWHQQAITRSKLRGDGSPESMMNRERMQQHSWKPIAGRFVVQLNVVTADLHGNESVYYYKIRVGARLPAVP
jgi:hypothetical protein